MERSFDHLLAEANDRDLCGGVFELLLANFGDDIDASALDEAHRVVLLVWHVTGIIGNGGFRYLFEGSLTGDPYFSRTAEAFRAIGCKKAADAFRKALAIFPDSMPQRNIDERLRYYLRRIKGTPTEADRQFFAAMDDVTKCLANYIRSRADDFRNLSDARRDQEEWRQPEPSPQMRREGPKRVPTIADLPQWARVAFAARCARKVLPLRARHWPQSPEKYTHDVRTAIELAELSAGEGRPVDGLNDARTRAVMAAGAALMGESEISGLSREDAPADAYSGTIAAHVAKAAENAAECARVQGEDSKFAAMQAWGFAADAASAADEPDIVQELKDDFARLFRVAKRGRWTDRTKVPVEIWSML
jgi:hypothetical protein